MINVLNMTKTSVVDDLFEFKFDFEFDNASTLPTKFVIIEQQKYLIANDSTAKNLSTNTYYKYNSADVCWVRSLAKTPTPTPKDNTQITENGNYNIINNSFTGYNDINVNVSGSGGDVTLIEKSITENGTYSAADDEADGYSSVIVNVAGGTDFGFSSIPTFNSSGTSISRCCYNSIDGNGTFNVTFGLTSLQEEGNFGTSAILCQPAKKVNISYQRVYEGTIVFTPTEDFDGFYDESGKLTLTGDEIIAGGGKVYEFSYNAPQQSFVIKAFGNNCTVNE